MAMADPDDATTAARLFHETYERLAPSFGYETRKASAVPWDEVPEPNRSLMIAVAGEVRARIDVEATARERQRIRQLAIDVDARYVTHELPDYTTSARRPKFWPFADLLDGDGS